MPSGFRPPIARLSLLLLFGLLASALLLDQHAVGMLTVITPDIGLDQVTALEARTMRSISKMVNRIRWWKVLNVTTGLVEHLLPGTERGVMIEPKIGHIASEKQRQPIEKVAQQLAELARVLGDDPIRKHLAELLESNPASRLNGDGWSDEARHQSSD